MSGHHHNPITQLVGGVVHTLTDPVGTVAGGAAHAVVDAGGSALGKQFMDAWNGVVQDFLTSWMKVGLPVQLEGTSVTWLIDLLKPIGVVLAVLGIMLAGIRTMATMRGDAARRIAWSTFWAMLVAGLGVTAATLGVDLGDHLSSWILDQVGANPSQWMLKAFAVDPGLMIIAGIIGTLATMFQWGLMLLRQLAIPLLAGAWPTTAAAAMVSDSQSGFVNCTKYLLALILYKPAAAVIYALAFKLQQGGDGTRGVVAGVFLEILAILALPALIRLFMPISAAMGRASGGAMAIGATGAIVGMGVAAGATVVTAGAAAPAAAAAASGGGAGGGLATGASLPAGGAAGGGSSAATETASGGGSSANGSSGGSGDGTAAAGSSGSAASGATPSSDTGGRTPTPTAGGTSRGGDAMRAAGQVLGDTTAEGANNVDGSGLYGGDSQ